MEFFRIQDTCTVMALIIMFLTFFATFVFQAGLISLLIGRFQASIVSTSLYLLLSIIYHVWSLVRAKIDALIFSLIEING